MTAALVLSVVAGAVLAQAGLLPPGLVAASGEITRWALYLLLVWIGYDIGRDRAALRRLFTADRYALLVPAGTVLGTLAGGWCAAWVTGLGLRESLAVAAGFGWYSLSAVILTDAGHPDLGSVAFLANVFRELLAIGLIPVVAKRLGPYVAVAPGGATTMDTTLPLIERYAGDAAALVGFVNGFLLSALVPVLVPLLLGGG
ncbi:MAG: lysine exporter LysO family protein [Candidatus Dadabacteria bacterium]|nr:MAG: lysine exporter LysO family protein [Candidatus Dadabacteria bacterium]